MNKDPLESAIDLIKMGKPADALPILSMLIRNNPHDENAWVWLIQAVPQNQRRSAAEMFFKDNPNSDLAKKALQAVGREIAHPEVIRPTISAVSEPEKIKDHARDEEFATSSEDELASMVRSGGNVLPQSQSDLHVAPTQFPIKKKLKLRPFILIGSAVIIIIVLIFVLTQIKILPGLSLPWRPSTNLNNGGAPLKTSTPVLIMSATQDKHATPTTGLATLAAPLTTPVSAQMIVPDNALNLKLISRVPAPQGNLIISPGLHYILPINGSSEINLLDFNTHATLFHAYLPADSLAVAAFSSNETYLAAGVNHGDIIIYDLQAAKSIRTIIVGSLILEKTGFMAFSPDGHTLAVISDGQFGVWNVDTGELLGNGSSQNVTIAVSSKTIFLTCASKVCADDITTNDQISSFETNVSSPQFAISADGGQIAIGSQTTDNLAGVTIYNIQNGAQLTAIKSTLSSIWGLSYSPDGRTVVAWGINSTSGQYSLILLDAQKGSILNNLDLGSYQANKGLKPIRLAFNLDGTGLIAITSSDVMYFAVP